MVLNGFDTDADGGNNFYSVNGLAFYYAAASTAAPEGDRALVLWLTNLSHAVNHFQNQMISALYPVIMAELDRLREELDEERMANAQLTERLKVQRERAERAAVDLRTEAVRLTVQVDEQALAMQRLVTATIRMREDLRRLRSERGQSVDPALIDKAMAAELDAGEALRAAETVELADLVAALTPIVQAEEARAHV